MMWARPFRVRAQYNRACEAFAKLLSAARSAPAGVCRRHAFIVKIHVIFVRSFSQGSSHS
jgi:hypothetical protein